MSLNNSRQIERKHKLEEFFIEITNACTHRCLHCAPRSGKPYPDELSLEQMQQIISEAKALGLRRLYLTGGEPLLRPECTLQLLEHAGKDIKKTVLTNGTVFTESLAERLANSGPLTRLEMSIFSASPEVHDHFTGVKGSLARMLDSTSNYLSHGIDVRWGFILTGINMRDIDQVLELASNLGVTHVGISRLVPSGRAMDNWSDLELQLDQLAMFLYHLDEIKANHGVNVTIGKTLAYEWVGSHIQPSSCNAAISRMFVQADGSTSPCPAFKDIPSFIGKNIRSISLTDVWLHSDAFEKLRSYSPGPETPCFDCMYANTCKGHCRAQQLKVSGTIERGCDPFCPVTIYNAVSSIVDDHLSSSEKGSNAIPSARM